ncbi:MAG: HemK/PrmC family methyltransferase [bacterium]|nr:HemK/PrmC family methyltransferase [bacterium]
MKTAYDDLLRMIVKDKYGGIACPEALKDAARAIRGEPLDYVIGWKPFLGARIDLSLRPLIPRPETEYWTEKAIKKISGGKKRPTRQVQLIVPAHRKDRTLRIADVFAGSGAIGIAVLKHVRRAHVDFGDTDPRCIKQIRKNLKLDRISKKKYRVVRSNIMQGLKGPYDLILANPPYIARDRKNKVEKGVVRYEPSVALWGGEDGLRFIRRLLGEAQTHLAPGGELWFEFDSWQKPALAKLLAQSSFKNFAFHKDQFGKWRYCIVGR